VGTRGVIVEQGVVCMSELLRMSSWEDEIQLKRELPVLSGEMWESQMG